MTAHVLDVTCADTIRMSPAEQVVEHSGTERAQRGTLRRPKP